MNKIIQTAIIGCGTSKRINDKEGWSIGHAHASGWQSADPNARLLGVDPNPDNLEAFGRKFGVSPDCLFPSTDALYEALTPDFVSVCTWPALHAPQTMEAMRRGVKGVICEKPFAMNPREIAEIVALADKTGCRVAIAHQRRLDPEFLAAKRLVDEGAIGQPLVFEGFVGGSWDVLSWTTHWFDMASYFFGEAPESVMAGIDYHGGRLYGHAVEVGSVVSARYSSGKTALFVTGSHSVSTDIVIRGSSGFITVGNEVKLINADGARICPPEERPLTGNAAMARELIDAASSNRPMTCDISVCAQATLTAYAAHESARLRRRVDLPIGFGYAPLELLDSAPRPHLPDGDIVLLADTHYGSNGREGIALAIEEETGRKPVLIEASEGLDQSLLGSAGIVVMYHTHAEPSDTTKRALEEWVVARKPLILIHAALGAYPGWDAFRSWAGRVWKWDDPDKSYHPITACRLVPVSAAWPLTECGLPVDEVWAGLETVGETVDLVSAVENGTTHPAAWITRDHPNVGVWVPGHAKDIWNSPSMRSGLFSLISIVARGELNPTGD
jgi:predicted dehydrogenase